MSTRNTETEMQRALDRYELFSATDQAADRLLSALDERRGREMQAADNEDDCEDAERWDGMA